MYTQALQWPRSVKRAIVILLDVLLCLVSMWLAFSLRLDTPHVPTGAQWWAYVLAPLIAIPIFIRLGLYRAIFRYTGLDALVAISQAIALYAVIGTCLLMLQAWPVIPRTLGLLQPIIFLLLVSTSRALARFWLAGTHALLRPANQGRMLIYGAAVVSKLTITDILLAIPSASRERRNKIIHSLRLLPVHTRTLPGLSDLASGRVTVRHFRELDVEDLLGRAPVKPQSELVSSRLSGQVILVTGAGGGIGSELCRQILQERPKRLLMLDHSEYGLYILHRELEALCTAQHPGVEIVPLLASVMNRARLDWICATYQPQAVYHAAAYKHVPMVECNASEGVINNVIGTLNMAQAARDVKVISFVLVSTDKAVRPTNLMGASKRMAELVVQTLADQADIGGTYFSIVRFGNVLGSSGSVVPLFRDQLAHGGPLTVTHPEVARYFMTIPEAVQLVLQAAAMAQGGEVFVLEMGEPVKILDLARRLVELSGLSVRDAANPDGDIELSFIGLRPGEKLYEELLIGDNPTSTEHPRIMKAHEEFLPWPQLRAQLDALERAAQANNEVGIRAVLSACVHGFTQAAQWPTMDAAPNITPSISPNASQLSVS